VLLHGWPDSHRLWRHQVAALTNAGYRCIVPDLRGFGDSDRPLDVEAEALPNIVGDTLGLLDQLGVERAHVIGHDWGAAVPVQDVGEAWVAADDFASLRGAWLTHPDIDALSAELSREGVLTASLNWYRANIPSRSLIEPAIELPPIAAPTMGV
jgi:alpha-beta hydrolase superfamily lysophospholipase